MVHVNGSHTRLWIGLFVLVLCCMYSDSSYALDALKDGEMLKGLQELENTARSGWLRLIALAVVFVGLVSSAVTSSFKPILTGVVIVVVSNVLIKYVTQTFTLLV